MEAIWYFSHILKNLYVPLKQHKKSFFKTLVSQYSQNCKDFLDEGNPVCTLIFNRCLCGIKFRSKSTYPHDIWIFRFIFSVEATKKKGNIQSNAGKPETVKPAGSLGQNSYYKKKRKFHWWAQYSYFIMEEINWTDLGLATSVISKK